MTSMANLGKVWNGVDTKLNSEFYELSYLTR